MGQIKFHQNIKFKGNEKCEQCGKKFKKGDYKYEKVIPDFSVAGRGAICEKCGQANMEKGGLFGDSDLEWKTKRWER